MMNCEIKEQKIDKIEIKKCDLLAEKLLNLDKSCMNINRHIFPELQSVYYSEPGMDGNALIICKDGSFLHARSVVPLNLHLEAFKNGLRSNFDNLKNSLS